MSKLQDGSITPSGYDNYLSSVYKKETHQSTPSRENRIISVEKTDKLKK